MSIKSKISSPPNKTILRNKIGERYIKENTMKLIKGKQETIHILPSLCIAWDKNRRTGKLYTLEVYTSWLGYWIGAELVKDK